MDLNLSDEEFDKIASVLQRDSKLRMKEDQRMRKIKQEINNESIKRDILSQISTNDLNEKCCILCCSTFNFLFNKKYKCSLCNYQICRNCAVYQNNGWICNICDKERILCFCSQWHCDNKTDSIRFGSAKLLKTFLNQPKQFREGQINAQNENMNSMINQNQQNSNDSESFHCNDADEDPVLIQVREHVEVLVEGILGGSLDSAHVDRPYINDQYDEIFKKYQNKLLLALCDMTRALYLSMENKPIYNEDSPTNSHVNLKQLISLVDKTTAQLPLLTKKSIYDGQNLVENLSFDSYEELLATAIINHFVERSQKKFCDEENKNNLQNSSSLIDVGVQSDLGECDSALSFSDHTVTVNNSDDEKDLRKIIIESPSFVLEEKIEEITTKSFTDFHQEKVIDEDDYIYPELNIFNSNHRVPFPEAGIDLVDISSNCNLDTISEDSGIRVIDLNSWEENWLFQKNKRVQNAQFGNFYTYNSLDLLYSPVAMLIPNPSQIISAKIGTKEIDEVSEISENNSFGSILDDFSDSETEEETKETSKKQIEEKIEEKTKEKTEGKTEEKTEEKTEKSEKTKCKTEQKINNVNKSSNSTAQKLKLNQPNSLSKVPKFVPKTSRNSQKHSELSFVLKPGDATVQSGILIQFCCQAKGTKPIQIAWFKKDILLTSNDRIRIFKSGEQHILEMKNTSLEDSSEYSCVAYNSFDYEWCDFNLTVKNRNLINNPKSSKKETKKMIKEKHADLVINKKVGPVVIQRTWAERAADLKKNILKTHEKVLPVIEIQQNQSFKPNFSAIVEREQKKWDSAIEWPENPYTSERINERIKQGIWSNGSYKDKFEKNEIIEEEKIDPAICLSISKDLKRYKKDYYVPELNESKEETLRSFDENIYSSSKYFDMNNKSKNEVELSENEVELSKSEVELIKNEVELIKNENVINEQKDELSNLPSVKSLVSKFSVENLVENSNSKEIQKSKSNINLEKMINSNENNMKGKFAPNNYQIHCSLTARSISREFQKMAKQNPQGTTTNKNGSTNANQNEENCKNNT